MSGEQIRLQVLPKLFGINSWIVQMITKILIKMNSQRLQVLPKLFGINSWIVQMITKILIKMNSHALWHDITGANISQKYIHLHVLTTQSSRVKETETASATGREYLRTEFVDAFCIVLKSGDLIAKAVQSIHMSTVIQQFQVLLLQHVKPHLLQCNTQQITFLTYFSCNPQPTETFQTRPRIRDAPDIWRQAAG